MKQGLEREEFGDKAGRWFSVTLSMSLIAAGFYGLGQAFPAPPGPQSFPLTGAWEFAFFLFVGAVPMRHLYLMGRHSAPRFIREVQLPAPPAKTITEVVEKVRWQIKPPEQDATEVYRLFNAEGALLYVGIGWRAKDRLRHHADTKPWWGEVVRCDVRRYEYRYQALAVEHAAIMFERPRHNKARGALTDPGFTDGAVAPLRVEVMLPATRELSS